MLCYLLIHILLKFQKNGFFLRFVFDYVPNSTYFKPKNTFFVVSSAQKFVTKDNFLPVVSAADWSIVEIFKRVYSLEK